MKKLILKFSTRTGRDHLAKIQTLTKNLGLEIESVEEVVRNEKVFQKVVHVRGDLAKLDELDRALIRSPSISRKAA